MTLRSPCTHPRARTLTSAAQVLTIHGIDRCDARHKRLHGHAAGLPTVHIDVVMAESTIEQFAPRDTLDWSLLQLAARE